MSSEELCPRLLDVLRPPILERQRKPRNRGITMVIDKGLGPYATRDLMEGLSHAIDMVKFAFGTSLLYPHDLLEAKIRTIREAGVGVYPGGTLTEIAFFQGKYTQFLTSAQALGFSFIEVSEGTIDLSWAEREALILEALDKGFRVLSEVGKKDPGRRLSNQRMQEQIHRDLELGVFKVIVEGRDSGKGVGIYDKDGNIVPAELETVLSGPWEMSDIIIEAPIPSQQKHLLLRLGSHVNLGNVQPEHVMALECMRQGLRSDTLQAVVDALMPRAEKTG